MARVFIVYIMASRPECLPVEEDRSMLWPEARQSQVFGASRV